MTQTRPSRLRRSAMQLLVGCIALALTTLLAMRLDASQATAALLYLLATVVTSLWGGLVESLLVAVVAILFLDYFFVPPLHSVLAIDDTTDVVALITFSTTVSLVAN